MDKYNIVMPQEVKDMIKQIEAAGFEAFAVGGCVRDCILGRTPQDWDITTSALPSQIKEIFARTIDTGIQHGTVTVMIGKTGYEITTYRIDGEYKDCRHPENVEFSSDLKDDLKRRDFTINAMAYNDSTGLVDEFDGINDLNKGIIRCVGDAKERFTEDALRMMRAIRFSAQLGFDIEENTYNAISKLSPSISHVSMERIQVELVKTLLSDNPGYVMRFYETGLFKYVLPDIGRVLGGRYSRNALTMLKFSKKQPVFRYAALLNTLEPENVRKTLRELKLDNYTVEHVTKLVANSKVTIEENEPALREAVHQYGRELIQMMFEHEAAIIATKEEITGIKLAGKKKHLIVLRAMYDEITKRGDCICIKDLDITGNDLMEYGLKGPEIGKTLNELLGVVIENPRLNDNATLIALIEHLN